MQITDYVICMTGGVNKLFWNFEDIERGSLVDYRVPASNEHIPVLRIPRAGGRPGCLSHPTLLLNRREQPLPILVSHECPHFAGLGRRLFAALDEIAWFSWPLGQGKGVITGPPTQSDRCVVRRVFDPGFPDICL